MQIMLENMKSNLVYSIIKEKWSENLSQCSFIVLNSWHAVRSSLWETDVKELSFIKNIKFSDATMLTLTCMLMTSCFFNDNWN